MTFSKDQKNVSLRLKDVPLDRADLSVHRRLWNNSVGNNLQKPLRVNTVQFRVPSCYSCTAKSKLFQLN